MPNVTKGQLNSPVNISQTLCRDGKAKDEEVNISEQRASLELNHSVNGIFLPLSIQKGCLAIGLCHHLIGCQIMRREEEALVGWRQMKEGEKKTKKDLRGEKAKERRATLKLQLGCVHQSDLTRTKTYQCQLGCFDWQQPHCSQVEVELQC